MLICFKKSLILFSVSAALILSICFYNVAYAKTGDLGEPLSSYDMGSAKTLTGKNVVVSLFVDTMYLKWSDDDKEDALIKLGAACDYLKCEADEAEVALDLIYDWRSESDLSYTGKVFFPIDESTYYTDLLDNRIDFWLRHKVSYDKLLSEYSADGIIMMIFFKETGRSYAICFDGTDIYDETLVVFSDSNAATYAHEMLHLFGAHDLYYGAEYTDGCVSNVKSKYPDELMLTVTENDDYAITKSLSPITKYHIGWLEYTDELKSFPELKR